MNLVLAAGSNLVEDSPVEATPELERCLNQVEYYQPLYGIAGFEEPLRRCRDRARAIEAASSPMGTKFRLIDFGSSLGYFPFFFADRGATTTGFDISPANTAVAVATQKLNRLPATFKTAALDLETVRSIPGGEYDVALILSVMHHITHRHGIEKAAELVARLIEKIPTLVLELAHRDEDVKYPWRESLPDDPLEIFRACGRVQIRTIGQFTSHLSGSTRPMFLVTRKD
jgi:O-antigen chain-terminating methyltransferase